VGSTVTGHRIDMLRELKCRLTRRA
jgi:hypothetical protein